MTEITPATLLKASPMTKPTPITIISKYIIGDITRDASRSTPHFEIATTPRSKANQEQEQNYGC
jgi:hypothetical protein